MTAVTTNVPHEKKFPAMSITRSNSSERARQPSSELFSEGHRAAERQPTEQERATTPPTDVASRLNWEVIVFWGFVVFSFAALIYALYVICAKSEGKSPF